ncbi:MAG: hypothetical protein AAF533_07305 [Acidobacteriota bacterium]
MPFLRSASAAFVLSFLAAASATAETRALVLPFAVEGRDAPWLAEGAADFLGESLSALGHDNITRGERARLAREAGLSGQRWPLASAWVLAERAGATHVIEGRCRWQHGRWLVTVGLIDLTEARLHPEQGLEVPADGLAKALAGLALSLGGEAPTAAVQARLERLSEVPTAGLQAWALARAEPQIAESHLRAACAAAPAFVAARLELAELLMDRGRADEARLVVDDHRMVVMPHHADRLRRLGR